jgi:hypothetical protein
MEHRQKHKNMEHGTDMDIENGTWNMETWNIDMGMEHRYMGHGADMEHGA